MLSTVSSTLAPGCLNTTQNDRRLPIVPAGGVAIADATIDTRDIAEAHHSAVLGGDDDPAVIFGRIELVRRAQRHAELVAAESACGGLHIRAGDRRRDLIKPKSHGGDARGIDLNADRRLLGAGHDHAADAGDLRDTLGDHRVRHVKDRVRRHRARRQRQHEDRRSRGVGLAECRKIGKVGWKIRLPPR